jgi:hypothetical protein
MIFFIRTPVVVSSITTTPTASSWFPRLSKTVTPYGRSPARGPATSQLETSRRFVELARAQGVRPVLEGVARGASDWEVAIVEAARELSSVEPSLYKCEVPLHFRGEVAEIEARSREIDAAVGCPWVVLSQGVEPDDFAAAGKRPAAAARRVS